MLTANKIKTEAGIQSLPIDLLIYLINFLDKEAIKNLNLVNNFFYKNINKNILLWKKEYLNYLKKVSVFNQLDIKDLLIKDESEYIFAVKALVDYYEVLLANELNKDDKENIYVVNKTTGNFFKKHQDHCLFSFYYASILIDQLISKKGNEKENDPLVLEILDILDKDKNNNINRNPFCLWLLLELGVNRKYLSHFSEEMLEKINIMVKSCFDEALKSIFSDTIEDNIKNKLREIYNQAKKSNSDQNVDNIQFSRYMPLAFDKSIKIKTSYLDNSESLKETSTILKKENLIKKDLIDFFILSNESQYKYLNHIRILDFYLNPLINERVLEYLEMYINENNSLFLPSLHLILSCAPYGEMLLSKIKDALAKSDIDKKTFLDKIYRLAYWINTYYQKNPNNHTLKQRQNVINFFLNDVINKDNIITYADFLSKIPLENKGEIGYLFLPSISYQDENRIEFFNCWMRILVKKFSNSRRLDEGTIEIYKLFNDSLYGKYLFNYVVSTSNPETSITTLIKYIYLNKIFENQAIHYRINFLHKFDINDKSFHELEFHVLFTPFLCHWKQKELKKLFDSSSQYRYICATFISLLNNKVFLLSDFEKDLESLGSFSIFIDSYGNILKEMIVRSIFQDDADWQKEHILPIYTSYKKSSRRGSSFNFTKKLLEMNQNVAHHSDAHLSFNDNQVQALILHPVFGKALYRKISDIFGSVLNQDNQNSLNKISPLIESIYLYYSDDKCDFSVEKRERIICCFINHFINKINIFYYSDICEKYLLIFKERSLEYLFVPVIAHQDSEIAALFYNWMRKGIIDKIGNTGIIEEDALFFYQLLNHYKCGKLFFNYILSAIKESNEKNQFDKIAIPLIKYIKLYKIIDNIKEVGDQLKFLSYINPNKENFHELEFHILFTPFLKFLQEEQVKEIFQENSSLPRYIYATFFSLLFHFKTIEKDLSEILKSSRDFKDFMHLYQATAGETIQPNVFKDDFIWQQEFLFPKIKRLFQDNFIFDTKGHEVTHANKKPRLSPYHI